MLEIKSRLVDNLARHIQEEGQVSERRAREHAEELANKFETWGSQAG
jgi:hypothetical protein